MGKRKPRLKWLRHTSHSTDTHGNDPPTGVGVTPPTPPSTLRGVLRFDSSFPTPAASLPGSETTSVNTETAGEEEAQPGACERCL